MNILNREVRKVVIMITTIRLLRKKRYDVLPNDADKDIRVLLSEDELKENLWDIVCYKSEKKQPPNG